VLLRFGILYVASIALLIATFFFLNGTRPANEGNIPGRGWSDNMPHPHSGLASQGDLKLTDSLQRQLLLVRHELLAKDSLITVLESQPKTSDSTDSKDFAVNAANAISAANVREITKLQTDKATDRQAITNLEKENAAGRLALSQMQPDKTALQQKLDEAQKDAKIANNQLTALHQANENLQSRLKEADHTTASSSDAQKTALNTKNAALERKSEELADELRFAEVDCNLSRADARQIVYNSRQRNELLTDALTTLTQLAKSPDAEIQKKAREKLATLRSIASSVHD
jgi:hypothetical protein